MALLGEKEMHFTAFDIIMNLNQRGAETADSSLRLISLVLPTLLQEVEIQ